MLKVGENYFACDECSICNDWVCYANPDERFDEDMRFECWHCPKIGNKLHAGVVCEDAVVYGCKCKPKGKRKTGAAYRRKMVVKKDKDLRKIFTYSYCPNAGYPKYKYVDGEYVDAGYIQYPKNSNAQKYWKKHSNRIVRRSENICGKGNQYRKFFEYWHTLY